MTSKCERARDARNGNLIEAARTQGNANLPSAEHALYVEGDWGR